MLLVQWCKPESNGVKKKKIIKVNSTLAYKMQYCLFIPLFRYIFRILIYLPGTSSSNYQRFLFSIRINRAEVNHSQARSVLWNCFYCACSGNLQFFFQPDVLVRVTAEKQKSKRNPWLYLFFNKTLCFHFSFMVTEAVRNLL